MLVNRDSSGLLLLCFSASDPFVRRNLRAIAMMFVRLSVCRPVCPSGTGVHCDHTVYVIAVFTRTWLRYVRALLSQIRLSVACRLSSVCNVGESYSGGWSYWQYFFTAVYAGHPWPPCTILRRSSQGNPPPSGTLNARRVSK